MKRVSERQKSGERKRNETKLEKKNGQGVTCII